MVVPHALAVWWGDGIELDRHAAAIGPQLRLGLWLLVALSLDHLVARRPQLRPPQHARLNERASRF
jgi:hypothetical protein